MLVLSLAATHHVEGQNNPHEPIAESINSENALEILSGSSRFIDAAPAFMIKGKSGGELLLDTGQLVKYGTTFSAIFKQPSQLKLLMTSRGGLKTTMIFDGEMITLASTSQGQQICYRTPTGRCKRFSEFYVRSNRCPSRTRALPEPGVDTIVEQAAVRGLRGQIGHRRCLV